MKTISIIKKIIVIAMIAVIAYMPEPISAMVSRPLQRGGLLAKSAHLISSLGSSYNFSTSAATASNNNAFKVYMQSHPQVKLYESDPGVKKVAMDRYAQGKGEYGNLLNQASIDFTTIHNPQLEEEFKIQQAQNVKDSELNRLRNLQIQMDKNRKEWSEESRQRMNEFDKKMEQEKINRRAAQKWEEEWDDRQLPQFLQTAQ